VPTTFEVHPAIGVARLGSSTLLTEEGFFLGPEPGIAPPERYRDPEGALRRQAARFRVFACERDDRNRLLSAAEVTPDRGNVRWTVHLANRKGVARRRFRRPGFRNHATGDDAVDRELIIDPGPRSVDAPGAWERFDTGRFRSTAVDLGAIATDSTGRLLVLGGNGRSGSDPQQPRLEFDNAHFVDNDHWYDDTSDGPVVAEVALPGGSVRTATAWVFVAPPDFAPGVTNLVTLYDALFDRAVARGVLEAPAPVSFSKHVLPILSRLLGYRWVLRPTGPGLIEGDDEARDDGGAARHWTRLADPSPAAQGFRHSVVERFRNPDRTVPLPDVEPERLLPRLSDLPSHGRGLTNALCLTPTQYQVLRAWGRGDFLSDLESPAASDEMLPDTLDRVALEACVGAPFFPGSDVNELVLGDASRFMEGEPFRLAHAAVRPGEVTAHGPVPWQVDFRVCCSEDKPGRIPRTLGWWPAQRPDDVFTSVGAAGMVRWDRGLREDYQDMVERWDRLGVVIDRGEPGRPFFIETERDTLVVGP
jgi:hypothetical protein